MRNSSGGNRKGQQKNAKGRTNLKSVIDTGAMLRQSGKIHGKHYAGGMAKSYSIQVITE